MSKKVLSGIAFVFIIGISLIAASNISKYSDALIQAFALKIDFYSYSTCTGNDFEDIEGVLFLSASDILVAKKVSSMQWAFKKVKCET